VKAAESIILAVAAIPAIYYFLVLYSTVHFFSSARKESRANTDFTPPVSCLKPVRGLDVDAYENFASFCRQDYPDYEILFCVDQNDQAVPVLQKLVSDFPERRIRILYGSGRTAINDKVARLVRLVDEAQHDMLVITDADVRVRPDYLRTVVSPFRDPKLGAATCLYASVNESSLLEQIQSVGMVSDFFAGIMVAWQLDGVKFTFGQSILTTRRNIEGFGGFQRIENSPADDLLVGRFAAEQGLGTKLLPVVVQTVADFKSLRDLLHKRIRWMMVMRRMRPWGHLGLVFTWGLPWALVALATHPTATIAATYLGTYLALRMAMTWLIGAWGMKQRNVWKQLPLIPLWDALAFFIWLASFGRSTIRWRGVDYHIREGRLVPVISK
jgi:ceramide glucosyltransferase